MRCLDVATIIILLRPLSKASIVKVAMGLALLLSDVTALIQVESLKASIILLLIPCRFLFLIKLLEKSLVNNIGAT